MSDPGIGGAEKTFGPLTADERETFTAGRSRQPATERLGIPDRCGALEEAEPGVLYRVGGISGSEPVRTDCGTHSALVSADEFVPRGRVTSAGRVKKGRAIVRFLLQSLMEQFLHALPAVVAH